MATAAELTFYQAVRAAEGIRQVAKAAAFATFQAAGFAGANLATYVSALATADDAYTTSVNSANAGPFGYTIPNTGGTNPGNIAAGSFGLGGTSVMHYVGNATETMGAIG